MKASAGAREDLEGLIERARLGDRTALGLLVEGHSGLLRDLLRHRLKGPRRAIDLEDLVQETFLRALQALGRFRWQGEGSFLRWLQGIGGNVILKEQGVRQRRHEVQLALDVPSHDASPAARLRRSERFERLQRALEQLSSDHRKVILLARIEGVPICEIARLMNRSADAVSHLLMRAVEKLKRSFGDTESFHLPEGCLGPGPSCPPPPDPRFSFRPE